LRILHEGRYVPLTADSVAVEPATSRVAAVKTGSAGVVDLPSGKLHPWNLKGYRPWTVRSSADGTKALIAVTDTSMPTRQAKLGFAVVDVASGRTDVHLIDPTIVGSWSSVGWTPSGDRIFLPLIDPNRSVPDPPCTARCPYRRPDPVAIVSALQLFDLAG